MVFHLFVNLMQEKIAMTHETKCIETIVITAAAAIIVIANRDMFFETRHVGCLLEKTIKPRTGSGRGMRLEGGVTGNGVQGVTKNL